MYIPAIRAKHDGLKTKIDDFQTQNGEFSTENEEFPAHPELARQAASPFGCHQGR